MLNIINEYVVDTRTCCMSSFVSLKGYCGIKTFYKKVVFEVFCVWVIVFEQISVKVSKYVNVFV